MTISEIKSTVMKVVSLYPIKKVTLFGSRADGTNKEDSDIDLIVEFSAPVTLIVLGNLKAQLEDMFNLEVDIIHGPLQNTDIIEVNREIELYAA